MTEHRIQGHEAGEAAAHCKRVQVLAAQEWQQCLCLARLHDKRLLQNVPSWPALNLLNPPGRDGGHVVRQTHANNRRYERECSFANRRAAAADLAPRMVRSRSTKAHRGRHARTSASLLPTQGADDDQSGPRCRHRKHAAERGRTCRIERPTKQHTSRESAPPVCTFYARANLHRQRGFVLRIRGRRCQRGRQRGVTPASRTEADAGGQGRQRGCR